MTAAGFAPIVAQVRCWAEVGGSSKIKLSSLIDPDGGGSPPDRAETAAERFVASGARPRRGRSDSDRARKARQVEL